GGFGTKIMLFYPEEILVPHAAITLGRPVKWTEDRREHLLAANEERGQIHDVGVGFDEMGKILALRDRFVHDAGAYTPYGIVVPIITSTQLPGPYRLQNYAVEFEVAYTNKAVVTPYRGAGRPHGVFVMERMIALIARELGLEPSEVRRRNFIQPDELPCDVGLTFQDGGPPRYDSGDYPAGPAMAPETVGAGQVRRPHASRGLVTSGSAIQRAARQVRDKALRLAASLLEVSPDDLELADGRARVRGAPGKELTLGALATVANPIRYAYGKEAAEAAL